MRTVRMATEVKLYRVAPDAYRGRKKLGGGKTGPSAYYFSDGPRGLWEFANWLQHTAQSIEMSEEKVYKLLHSARINFNQRPPQASRAPGDLRGYGRGHG